MKELPGWSRTALCALVLASPAAAGDMLGVSFTGLVYRVDSLTGNASFVGNSGWAGLNALARDAGGEFYSVSGSSLVRIDPDTGQGTLVADTGLASVRGLAFGSDGVLYALEDTSPGFIGLDDLYTIDPVSGAATFVGSTERFGLQALASHGDRLYGWECGTGGGTGAGLVIIDPKTAAVTDVNAAVNGSCSTILGIQTLTFDAHGRLYGAYAGLFRIRMRGNDGPIGAVLGIGATGVNLRGIDFLLPAP